jgi:tetratricopeptide (TPR) repeat protein
MFRRLTPSKSHNSIERYVSQPADLTSSVAPRGDPDQEPVRMSTLGCLPFRFVLLLVLCGGLLPTSAGCHATSGWVYNNSGRAYYRRGQYAMARDEFYRATLDDPQNADYRHNLAMALKKTGDIAGAERLLRQNLTCASAMHQPTYHSLAQLLVEQNRHAEAHDLLQGWATAQPYLPQSHVELAWLQREMGNPVAAEQSLRHALQVDPRNPAALAQLGQLYEDSGQADRAAAMYQRSLAVRWQQPQVQSRLQMIADGSQRHRVASRSALMQNPVPVQPAYAFGGPPNVAAQPPMTVISSAPGSDSAAVLAAAPNLGPTPNSSPTPISATSPTPVTFESPSMVGPVLSPNPDPAHVEGQLTADLPVVEPH